MITQYSKQEVPIDGLQVIIPVEDDIVAEN